MAKTIYFETEQYQDGGEGDFVAVALTGDTFDAKEIIKGLGDFHFSDQVGHGKAWRSDIIFKRDLVAGNPKAAQMRAIINKAHKALTDAGYSVVVRR